MATPILNSSTGPLVTPSLRPSTQPHFDRRSLNPRPAPDCYQCQSSGTCGAVLRTSTVVYFRCQTCEHLWSHRYTEPPSAGAES